MPSRDGGAALGVPPPDARHCVSARASGSGALPECYSHIEVAKIRDLKKVTQSGNGGHHTVVPGSGNIGSLGEVEMEIVNPRFHSTVSEIH